MCAHENRNGRYASFYAFVKNFSMRQSNESPSITGLPTDRALLGASRSSSWEEIRGWLA
jgi:hypothetical protein